GAHWPRQRTSQAADPALVRARLRLMCREQAAVVAWRHADIFLEDARKVLRGMEPVVHADGSHRVRRLRKPLATPLDAQALPIVVRRHADFSREQAVEAALAIAKLAGDVGDAFVLVGIVVLGALTQQ